MEEFGADRPELTGSLISMEFGPGGRIGQLWVSDPSLPEEGEDFQFVLPPVVFGEENAEDLFPGTILIGARTSPNEPWVFARNTQSESNFISGDEEFNFDPSSLSFDYEFPVIPELKVTGRFFEVAGQMPQLVWEVEVINEGKKTIEIGELGFPLALNTFYEGFGWNDEQLKRLWNSRLYVHKFIGGAASYVFAQRMTSEPPGLLIFPADERGWEFCASVQNSLTTNHQWEGIPVVYAYSRATVDREGWEGWWNEHTSLILEPGDRRKFIIKFVPTDRDKFDGVNHVLAACGNPAIRVFPSAVAPVDVGIGIEIQGATPARFYVSRQAHIEHDADEDGGFAFVKVEEPGRLRVSFEDTQGRMSHIHLMFTATISELIERRSQYIVNRQVCTDPSSPLYRALLPIDTDLDRQVTDLVAYAAINGVECSLGEALFLAEKNTFSPVAAEIEILESMIETFIRGKIQNPGDGSVGNVIADAGGVATYTGRPSVYPALCNLYFSMFRIAGAYGTAKFEAETYLKWAYETARAMYRFGWRNYIRTVGILGHARIYEFIDALQAEGKHEWADTLDELAQTKSNDLVKLDYPYAGESVLDTGGFEDVYMAGLKTQNDEHSERTQRCSFAARSLSPSWWWYGSDKRSWDGVEMNEHQLLQDRGEACLAHTTPSNALMFFESLDRDYMALPEVYMRLAFGGMLGPWALIRKDGAASMCYCPDPASKHYGYNPNTGMSGHSYYHFLVGAGSYVLPAGSIGTFNFGCHFNSEEGKYSVKPWDGVGRKVILRQICARFETTFGKMELVELAHDKRSFLVEIKNPSDRLVKANLEIEGLWGTEVAVFDQTIQSIDGVVTIPLSLPARSILRIPGRVVTR